MPTTKTTSIVVSALDARANFGNLLTRVDEKRRSLIIEKRGTPRAILLSIRDYVKLAAPEPEVLRILGEVSEPILAEYADVLARPELRIRKGLRLQLLQLIRNHSHLVAPSHRLEITSDPDDNIFLECADAARADYLITGNTRHFPVFWKKTRVITSREFISLTAPHLIP